MAKAPTQKKVAKTTPKKTVPKKKDFFGAAQFKDALKKRKALLDSISS